MLAPWKAKQEARAKLIAADGDAGTLLIQAKGVQHAFGKAPQAQPVPVTRSSTARWNVDPEAGEQRRTWLHAKASTPFSPS